MSCKSSVARGVLKPIHNVIRVQTLLTLPHRTACCVVGGFQCLYILISNYKAVYSYKK